MTTTTKTCVLASLLGAAVLGSVGCTATNDMGPATQFPGTPATGGAGGYSSSARQYCFYEGSNPVPAVTTQYTFEVVEGIDATHVTLIFSPWFVDNTYGVSSIGWRPNRPHTFKDLLRSDNTIITMRAGGADVLSMRLDYLHEDDTAPSGYSAAGVWGGDGEMVAGDIAMVLDATSSLDRNLNERGYAAFLDNSPATNADYATDPNAPNWDYRVVYEAWVDNRAFGDADLDAPTMDFVHASPAKGADTLDVTEGDCPEGWGCTDPDGCAPGMTGPGDDGSGGGGSGGGGGPGDGSGGGGSGGGSGGGCVANEYGEGCFDRNDNDCDGLADCADPDCTAKCEAGGCTADSDCGLGQVCYLSACVMELE